MKKNNINQVPSNICDEPYITPTKEDLQRRFKEYNELYFYGELPKCPISIGCNKKIGWGVYVGRGKIKPHIYICGTAYWTDETLKAIIIHEMVHHYVEKVVKPKFWEPPHGYHFTKKCKSLEKEFGLKVEMSNIPLSQLKGEIVPTSWFGEMRRRFLGPKFLK